MPEFDLSRAGSNFSSRKLSQFRLEGLHPADKVAPNFTLGELLRSSTAERHGIVNFSFVPIPIIANSAPWVTKSGGA